MKILIAETGEFYKGLLQQSLEEKGHTILSACDEETAWTLFHREKGPVLILLDATLPAAQNFCKKLVHAPPPHLFYLLYILPENLSSEPLIPLCASDFICSPFSENEIHARIQISIHSLQEKFKQQVQMEEEMERLAVVVHQSADSIIITDLDGSIRYVNYSFEHLTGYSPDEVIGKNPNILKSGHQDAAFYLKLWNTIQNGKSWKGHLVNRRKDGHIYEVNAVIYPIRNRLGEIFSYVSIRQDITREVEQEKQLRQTQKMNAIGELARGVAHDFNNILTAILGYVTLCQKVVKKEEKAYDYLGEIAKAGNRASKLVNQILAFSRQEEQNFKPVSMQQVIQDSLDLIRPSAEEGIQIKVDLDANCPPVFGDPTQLQQAILNLCTNAIHSMRKKGILSVHLCQTTAAPINERYNGVSPPHAHISVKDTGCGIPEEAIDRIFEPYFTTKNNDGGSGFGLAIVHSVVQRHRGTIKVESTPKRGTCFNLYFPLLPDTEGHSPSPSEDGQKPASSN